MRHFDNYVQLLGDERTKNGRRGRICDLTRCVHFFCRAHPLSTGNALKAKVGRCAAKRALRASGRFHLGKVGG